MTITNILLENGVFLCILILICLFFLRLNSRVKRYSEHREFSKTESPIEELLFQELRKREDKNRMALHVYTQVPCGPYRIDLVLYSSKGKIAIECDGKQYHTAINYAKNDKNKNYYLEKRGWRVFRFTGSEIYRNSRMCVDEIIAYIESK